MTEWRAYGKVFGAGEPTLPPVGSPGSSAAGPPGGAGRYAGFWRRVAASLVDAMVVTGGMLVLMAVLLIPMFVGIPLSQPYDIGVQVVLWIGSILYVVLMHSSAKQATVGKLALGIKVTDLEGRRISIARATGRFFASWLSQLTLGIGFVMAGFTQRRQALHDKIAGTYVVTTDAEPAAIAAGLDAPKVSGAVVVLAILAGFIPAAGIVAAIAIPAYQDYTIRTQVANALTAAAPYKAAVTEAAARGADLVDVSLESLQVPQAPPSPYVKGIDVVSGAVVISFGGKANRVLTGKDLVLAPGTTEDGRVVWTCGLAPMPEEATPSVEDPQQYTSVPEKYLPERCRSKQATAVST
jgi:uncharacterized RDD family membrane protein YckC/Tfp pilus assembly major pilin PilA